MFLMFCGQYFGSQQGIGKSILFFPKTGFHPVKLSRKMRGFLWPHWKWYGVFFVKEFESN